MLKNFHSEQGSISITGVVIIFMIIATVIFCIFWFPSYYTPKYYTVQVTDKDVKNGALYLVFTKVQESDETRVFCIKDSLFKWRFNSSDYYADVEVGKTYDIEVIGFRIPILSMYENIMVFTEHENKE